MTGYMHLAELINARTKISSEVNQCLNRLQMLRLLVLKESRCCSWKPQTQLLLEVVRVAFHSLWICKSGVTLPMAQIARGMGA